MEPLKGDDESLDAFYRGRILILQKKNGFRFSLDAPLLADFIRTEAEDELLELGTGCGVVALLLSIKPFRSLTALEIQDSLFDLAFRNVRLNHLDERIRVLRADLREYSCRRLIHGLCGGTFGYTISAMWLLRYERFWISQ